MWKNYSLVKWIW